MCYFAGVHSPFTEIPPNYTLITNFPLFYNSSQNNKQLSFFVFCSALCSVIRIPLFQCSFKFQVTLFSFLFSVLLMHTKSKANMPSMQSNMSIVLMMLRGIIGSFVILYFWGRLRESQNSLLFQSIHYFARPSTGVITTPIDHPANWLGKDLKSREEEWKFQRKFDSYIHIEVSSAHTCSICRRQR